MESDSIVPENWEQIADMRLKQLEKEYLQCVTIKKEGLEIKDKSSDDDSDVVDPGYEHLVGSDDED